MALSTNKGINLAGTSKVGDDGKQVAFYSATVKNEEQQSGTTITINITDYKTYSLHMADVRADTTKFLQEVYAVENQTITKPATI